MTDKMTPAQGLEPQCEICGAALVAKNGDAVCPNEDDAEHCLTYWLDEPPTSNSGRYAMEQTARAVLKNYRAQAAALAEREAGVIGEIATERQRQINKEGWTPEHDDEHTDGSLAAAAATYAAATTADGVQLHKVWPKSWDIRWYKPASKRRDLIKAAALIVAEIERLDRQALKESTHE